MGIKLSKNYGVNPTILLCPICGKDVGIGLVGKLPGDKEAPKYSIGPKCPFCQEVEDKDGCVIIEVQDGEENSKNPYRTGRFIGINNQVKAELKINSDFVYMTHTGFEKLFGKAFEQQQKPTE